MNEHRAERAASRDVKASPKIIRTTRAGVTRSATARSRDASRRAVPSASPDRKRGALSSAETKNKPVTSRDASSRPSAERAPLTPVGFVCPPCGRFIPIEVDGLVLRSRTGSPPRFCSPGCRQAAYRRRRAGVAEDVALQLRGGRDRSLGGAKGEQR